MTAASCWIETSLFGTTSIIVEAESIYDFTPHTEQVLILDVHCFRACFAGKNMERRHSEAEHKLHAASGPQLTPKSSWSSALTSVRQPIRPWGGSDPKRQGDTRALEFYNKSHTYSGSHLRITYLSA